MMMFAPVRWAAAAAAAMLMSAASAQQTWYIHAQAGDDANNGRSPAAPFKTLARWQQSFESLETTEGDTVLLSGTFREYLNINMLEPAKPQHLTIRRWEATDANPLSLPLAQPVIRGDTPVTGWSRAGETARFTATARFGLSLQSVVWNWDTSVDSYGRNLGHLRKVSSTAAVEATPYSWSYDGLNLHVNVTPAGGGTVDPNLGQVGYVQFGPNGGLMIQSGVGCTMDGLESYLWLNDLTGSYGFSFEHGQDCTISNCRTRDTSHHGMGFTGFTGSGNRIIACEVRGLMGLRVDNAGDCFGMLSNNRTLTGCLVSNCTAHCYSLLTPEGLPLNPPRQVHGFRTGTTQSGRLAEDVQVDDFTVYSYFPECGMYSTPVRIEDAAEPTNPLDASTYGVRFNRLRVVRGGYMNLSGYAFHASFVGCDLNFSECSLRGLQTSGAIASAVGLGGVNHVLFAGSTITANVDNPNGQFWPGLVFSLRTGTAIHLDGCLVEETGLRARGSTAVMAAWLDGGGSMLARDTTFMFDYARGVRKLCGYDGLVTVAQRDFSGCVYSSLSPGNSYTEWYGPAFGLPDIRSETGWLTNMEGDPYGLAVGNRGPAAPSRVVFQSGGEAQDAPK